MLVYFYPQKECIRPILHSRRTRTRVGNMESQGWINKTLLGFQLWKSCPPLLSYIRRYKEAETLNCGKRRDGKGNRTSICSVSHATHCTKPCYTLSYYLLRHQRSLSSRTITVMIIRDTGYSCPGKTGGWASLTLRVDQGGRVRPAKRRSTDTAPGDGGWETGMCSWMTMSCLNHLNYFHLFFSSELSM